MFTNLSFEIKPIVVTDNSTPLIQSEQIGLIVNYIATKGKEISTINGLAESISRELFINKELVLDFCKQILQIRNLCANWMNCNSNVGEDITDNSIVNTVAPITLTELQENVWLSSKRWYEFQQSIIADNTGKVAITELDESLRPNFDAIIGAVILYSKLDVDNNPIGNWDYYKDAIKFDYNYTSIDNQLNG